jgi:glycosyltransferase involved in cell wall biosynthesis
MTGTLTVDAADAAAALDLSGEERWHVLVLHRGRPAARVDLASPGQATPALVSAAVLRWADAEIGREQLVERLRARLAGAAGDRTPPSLGAARDSTSAADRAALPAVTKAPPLRCSVIVCTHRRPADLARLLPALEALDPAPAELIVVDNDPGDDDCRTEAVAAGAHYVREDRRGLDNARNAGIRAASGDVVAFIDDDCVPSPGWLRRLPIEFANPTVGAVTGPAFPLVLDTPARERMERQASLARGLQRLELDWMTFPIAAAGALGVGANMAFRREVLEAFGPEPFPPELDAGTATESGGDTYVLAKVLARGHRVVYDPATFVYHRHRGDGAALHRAVFGYGVGLGAALTRLVVKDRELSAPATGLWLLGQYRRTQQRRMAGRADSVETRLAWDYVRGGALGALRWRRALREVGEAAAGPVSTSAEPLAPQAFPAGSASPQPAVSVIVPTCQRPRSLERCLAALAAQDVGLEQFEVVLVDDSPSSDAVIPADRVRQLRLQRVDTRGRGAAAARNAGATAARAPLLLFLDDDVVARPDLVRRHRERHAAEAGERAEAAESPAGAEDVVVVGAYLPRPTTQTLAASAAALWWEDLFHAMDRSVAPTYVNALTGNMSISHAAFERSGGFDPRFGRFRREDWEWGVRAAEAGLRLCFEPLASGDHEYALDAPGRLHAAELEGRGDALMLDRHPHAAAAILPLVADPSLMGGRRGGLERAAWALPAVRTSAHTLLAALEWARLRLPWVRLFNAAQRLSYEHGVRSADLSLPTFEEPLLDVDLDGSDSIPAPGSAPVTTRELGGSASIPASPPVPATLRIRVGGREVARIRPALGQWTPQLAEQIVLETPWQAVEQAAAATGCLPERDERHDHASRTQVIFGPAHGPADVVHADQLTAAGTTVEVVNGPRDEHWPRVVAAAEGSRCALIALTLPGVCPGPGWLEQALVAFDGSAVGAVVGRALPDAVPAASVAPLVLHAYGDDDPELEASVTPQYVVLRRELLPALALEVAHLDPVAPVLALVADALEGGWVVGYRDVAGLTGAGPDRFDGERAATALRLRRTGAGLGTAAAELRRSSLVAAWRLIRRQGTRATLEAYAGALSGLGSSAAWRSSTPRHYRRR